MSEHNFRFSHDKRLKGVSFNEFLKTARELCEAVVSVRSSVDITVLTCEDDTTYNYSTSSFASVEHSKAIKNRKSYTLDEFTEEVWDRSLNAQLTLKDQEDPKPFMICLSCDMCADAKSMKFYGQCLDGTTYQAIVSKFRSPTLSYGIGDGYSKVSALDMAKVLRSTSTRP